MVGFRVTKINNVMVVDGDGDAEMVMVGEGSGFEWRDGIEDDWI